ncbi:MAG: ATP-binding protein, partial [Saprospiraceae bacterium]|nr:ATP-binding protein [Saprospiraceae bacterium]
MISAKSSNNHEECSPRPAAMISSLRAFGYDLPMAIADLIDNSIYACARTVKVDYDWNDGDPWIRVLDDGRGMTEGQLREAMRLGSQSPLETRHVEDLGRFGLGLKTASFSQCKLLTVHTKTHEGNSATRSWDLEHVCDSGKWELGIEAPRESHEQLAVLDSLESGTIVLCQKLDRIIRSKVNRGQDACSSFLEAFGTVARYLEMVFHRYLAGRDNVTIFVGRHRCKPWDPFLKSNEFTQHLSVEYLDDHQITVRPFVLPHVSKRSQEETFQGAGLYGWNSHQGFYIYRNKRMIIPGGYLDLPFKAEEHYKLCRIQIDLPNHLDHQWGIDVRKAAARPPSNVRGDLERIARASRTHAAEVYRARAGKLHKTSHQKEKHDVWIRKPLGDKVIYRINRNNEAIKRILAEIDPPASWVKKLFHLIEKTVPHRLIILDNANHEDCLVDLPPEFQPPPDGLIKLCCEIF